MSSVFNFEKAISVIKETVAHMPYEPGIYKMLDADGNILYIGKAKVLPKRVVSYQDISKLSYRIKRMVSQIRSISYEVTNTETEALLLEANLIKLHLPPFNVMLKDDRSFPYIFFDERHEYPRITRYRGKKNEKGDYFGPYSSAFAMNQAITEIQKIFLMRPCTDSYFETRTRPCIQYDIKRCSAPCVGKISVADYKPQVQLAKDFLLGKNTVVQDKLIKQMEEASARLDFEKAAQIRDKLKAIASIKARNIITDNSDLEVDVVVMVLLQGMVCVTHYRLKNGQNFGSKNYFFSEVDENDASEIFASLLIQLFSKNNPPLPKIWVNLELAEKATLEQALSEIRGKKVSISIGDKDIMDFALNNAEVALKKEAKTQLKTRISLEGVAKLFGITKEISRIEIYDNSHVFGQNAIGAMVVFTNSGFTKNEYRIYNIQNLKIGDDYAMLRQVLKRRIKNLIPQNKPDLMLIDGGKGHLEAARDVIEEHKISDIKLVAISKGPDRNAGREYFHILNNDKFQLPKDDARLHFLQVLRDEAHRFAITSHRKKRSKVLIKSQLDDLPGIGKNRKKLLLQYFGSWDGVKEATATDLAAIPGIGKSVANKVFKYLHG